MVLIHNFQVTGTAEVTWLKFHTALIDHVSGFKVSIRPTGFLYLWQLSNV